MAGFVLIFSATFVIAFVAIRVLRALGDLNFSSSSLVSLSPGKGQNRRQRQKGFVHARVNHDRSKVSKPQRSVGALRQPWGW